MIKFLVLVFFFVSMLGMGFLKDSALGIPGIPFITIPDIIIFILLVHQLFRVKSKNNSEKPSLIKIVVIMTILAVIFRLLLNALEFLPLFELIKNANRLKNYMLFFFLSWILEKDTDLEEVVKYMQVLFFIGAVSFFVQYYFKLDFTWKAEYSAEFGYRIRHVIFPMALIAGMMNFSLLINSNEKRGLYFSFFVVSSVIMLLSMYRNYYIAFPIGLLLIIIINSIKNQKKIKSVIIISVVVVMGIALLSFTGVFDVVNLRVLSIQDELTQNKGTFAVRVLIWTVKFNAISKINPWLGIGFNWDNRAKFSPGDSDEIAIAYITNPYVIDADNGYATLFVILGYVGIVLFLILYMVTYVVSLRLLKTDLNTLERSICLTAASFSIIVLFVNFGLDNFYWPYAVLPNLLLLSLISYIEKKHKSSVSIKGNA
ncbi:MAG: O-antigen ligase family protein [Clostridiales bacterium]